MQTFLRVWYIIKVIDDETNRFDVGDYVSTSLIEKIDGHVVTTVEGSE